MAAVCLTTGYISLDYLTNVVFAMFLHCFPLPLLFSLEMSY